MHKESITVAYAIDAGEVESLGKISATQTEIDRLCKRPQSKASHVRVAYEAGPCGYGLHLQLTQRGFESMVDRRLDTGTADRAPLIIYDRHTDFGPTLACEKMWECHGIRLAKDPGSRNDLLEVLDDRVGTRSTIITSQLPQDHWHAWLQDPTLADPILDRLVHQAHKLPVKGESMRKPKDADEKLA